MVAATQVPLVKVTEAVEDEEVLVVLAVVDVAVEEVDEAEVTVDVEAETTTVIMKDQEVEEAESGGVVVLQELEGPHALLHQPPVDERQPVVAHRGHLALLQIWMKKVENIYPFYQFLPFAHHNFSPLSTQSSSRPHRHLQNRGRLPLNPLSPNLRQHPLRMRLLELGQAGTRTQALRTRSVVTVARSLSSVRSRKRASTKAVLSESARQKSAAFSYGETNP